MKNKRNIIAFILLLLPLLVAVGMSTWIILNESLLTPSYNPDPVIKKYFSGEESVIYDGNEQAPVSSVENLIEFGDLEFSYKPILDTTNNYISGKPKNAGVYDVKVSVKNLDNSSTNVKFTIEPKEISISIDGENPFIYNRTNQTPQLKIIDGLIGEDKCNLDVDKNFISVNAGNYTLTKDNIILSNSNYTLSDSTSFNYIINPKSITSTDITITGVPDFINLGTNLDKDNIRVMDGDIQLAIATDYVITEENLTVLGTGYVNITGNGNYTGIIKKEIKVKEVLLALNLTCDQKQEKTYNKQGLSEVDLHINVTCDSQTITGYNLVIAKITDPNNNDYGTDITEIITVGTYYISLYVTKDNYEQSNTCQITYSINKREINIEWSNLEFTYDGNTKIPTATATNLCAGDDCTITVTGGQINANVNGTTYTATADTLSNTNYKLPSNKTRTFKINPFKIKLSQSYLTITSNGTKKAWSDIQSGIKPNFTNMSGNTTGVPANFSNISYTVTGIQDGEYYFGSNYLNDKSLKTFNHSVIGSTYQYQVQLNDTNYIFGDSSTNKEIGNLKYQTVKIGSSYYTIEDALNKGGNIVLDGCTDTILTKFTLLSAYSETYYYTLGSSSTLWITFDGNMTDHSKSGGNKIWSTLYVPDSITLDSYGKINVCGVIASNNHTVSGRGVLFNNGLINVNSSSSLNSYGFVNGDGLIDAKSGSTVTDVMRFYNFTSGGPTLSMSNAKIFPLNSYSMHNVSCTTKLDKNSIFRVFYDVDITVTLNGYLTLIGSSGLFDLSTGYVMKSVEDTTSSTYASKSNLTAYSVSNQNITQREVIDIYGTFNDNIVSIEQSGKGITTGKNYAMPIGFMNISLKDDGKGNIGEGTLSANSYKFLPGSSFYIGDTSTLTISSGINVIFYDEYDDTFTYNGNTGSSIQYNVMHKAWYDAARDDFGAQFIINGTLSAVGNVGGVFKTTSKNGRFTIAKNSATLKKMTNLTYDGYLDKGKIALGGTTATCIDDTVQARGLIAGNTTISQFTANKSYKSSGTDWYIADDIVTISLNPNGGTLQSDSLYDILKSNGSAIIKINTGEDGSLNINNPTRTGYEFDGWYLDAACTISANNATVSTNTTLYAGWVPITYNINYEYVYRNCSTSGTVENPNTTTYNIESQTIEFNTESMKDGNLVFGGWYKDVNCTIPISGIPSGSYGDITIYGVWYSPADANNWNVTLNIGNGFDNRVIKITTINSSVEYNPLVNIDGVDVDLFDYKVDDLTDYNYPKYFAGWYTDSSFTTLYTGTITGDITLYGKWNDKVSVTVIENANNTTIIGPKYFKPEDGKAYNIGEITPPTITGYNYKGYTVTGATLENNKLYLPNEPGAVVTVVANYEIKKYVITVKNESDYDVTLTITIDGGDTQKATVSKKTGPWTSNSYPYGTRLKIYAKGSWKKGYITNDGKDGFVTVDDNLQLSYTITNSSCLVEGTLITLADGTTKKVEDLTANDLLLVFNHETGKYDKAPASYIIHMNESAEKYRVITLIFSDGTRVGIVGEHGFFNISVNEYVFINEFNISSFIGNQFYSINNNSVTLVNYEIEEKITRIYSPISTYYLNCFANGMLTVSNFLDGFVNIFKLDENMKYNEKEMEENINKYGLSNISDFLELADEELIIKFAYQYVGIAIAQGKLSTEKIRWLIETFLLDKYIPR